MTSIASAQIIDDTIKSPAIDSSALRIINMNSYFNQHVDSTNVYQFIINRQPTLYYWYIKNAPVGLTINKDNGKLSFKAAKNYFLSGKLKYDFPYTANLSVQSLNDPKDKVDTSFSISFYNTEIIPSSIKLSVSNGLTVDEGETVSFSVQCETGSFPFESILFNSNVPLMDYTLVKHCNDVFTWTPGFDFVKDNDQNKEKTVTLSFIGITRSQARDTATIRIVVKNALNFPKATEEFELVNKNIRSYILLLKYTFVQVDKRVKKVKSYRTAFDLTSTSTALTGSILMNTASSPSAHNTGQILPSVGVALIPIKDATVPNNSVELNQASQIRTGIKRLEYMLSDNLLIGDRDNDILIKTSKLKDGLKQVQGQLVDIPVDITANMTEEELNNYFNSPAVNKKYNIRKK